MDPHDCRTVILSRQIYREPHTGNLYYYFEGMIFMRWKYPEKFWFQFGKHKHCRRHRKTRVDEISVSLEGMSEETLDLSHIYQECLPGADRGCDVLHLMAEVPFEPVPPATARHVPPSPQETSLPPAIEWPTRLKATFQESLVSESKVACAARQEDQVCMSTSASYLAGISVRSAQKLFIFIVYTNILWIKVSNKYFILFWKQKHWCWHRWQFTVPYHCQLFHPQNKREASSTLFVANRQTWHGKVI